MLRKVWDRLRSSAANDEVRADEAMVSRELRTSAPAPELAPLAAARGATLADVRCAFIDSVFDSGLPGSPVPGLEMIGLSLRFERRPLLSLTGHSHGEGLRPCEEQDIFWDGVDSRDLNEAEPFASVVGTEFRELTLLSHRGHYCHVGIRLQFERADLVLLNLWDDIEAYPGLVPEVLQPYNEPGRIYTQLYEYPFEAGPSLDR